MKRLPLLLLFFFPGMTLAQNGVFTIAGSVKNYTENQKVYLINKQNRDSAIIKNGKFSFKGHITISNEPDENYADAHATLFLDHTGKGINFNIIYLHKPVFHDSQSLYLEPGKITVDITDSVSKAVVKSGPLAKEHLDLDSIYSAYHIKMNRILTPLLSLPEQVRSKRFLPVMDSVSEVLHAEQKADMWNYIKTHPNAPASLYILKHNDEFYPDYDLIYPYYAALSSQLRATKFGTEYGAMLAKLKTIRTGETAPEFTMTDQNEIPVALKSYKGKYLLVDFWASWCSPCRQESPYLVKAYNLFRFKNFDILGVSLDSKKVDWMNAIDKDHLKWVQVSDLREWDNTAATLYGVKAIPQNFLLDPQGKIIAKNLFGNELILKLRQILSDDH